LVVRELEAVAVEGVAYTEYLFADGRTRPVHDDVDGSRLAVFNLFVVHVVLSKHKWFAFSRSKDEPT
jgi:hypothetical protein